MNILTIGRKGTDIVLDDPEQQISRLHAEVTVTNDGKYYLVDCGSINGTFLRKDGAWQRIKQEYVGRDEEIRFGAHLIITGRNLIAKAKKPASAAR